MGKQKDQTSHLFGIIRMKCFRICIMCLNLRVPYFFTLFHEVRGVLVLFCNLGNFEVKFALLSLLTVTEGLQVTEH